MPPGGIDLSLARSRRGARRAAFEPRPYGAGDIHPKSRGEVGLGADFPAILNMFGAEAPAMATTVPNLQARTLPATPKNS